MTQTLEISAKKPQTMETTHLHSLQSQDAFQCVNLLIYFIGTCSFYVNSKVITEILLKFTISVKCYQKDKMLIFRDDKLIKTVVTFNAHGKMKFQPGRYFLRGVL